MANEMFAGLNLFISDKTVLERRQNLTISYLDFGYSGGLVTPVRLECGIKTLRESAPIKVTIERVNVS